MESSLKHYGVLGMKWGFRRNTQDSSSADHQRSSEIKKKKLKNMSNEELRTLNTRLQLEKQYKDLNPSTMAKAKKVAGSVLNEVGKEQAKKYATMGLIAAGSYVVKTAFTKTNLGGLALKATSKVLGEALKHL